MRAEEVEVLIARPHLLGKTRGWFRIEIEVMKGDQLVGFKTECASSFLYTKEGLAQVINFTIGIGASQCQNIIAR